MAKLKFLSILLIIGTMANAQSPLQSDAEKNYEEEMSLEMCRSLDHRFESDSNECIYCAHGLSYNLETLQCVGTPDVIGKCFGDDHYHAKTQECMYCAQKYIFNDDIKGCMQIQ